MSLAWRAVVHVATTVAVVTALVVTAGAVGYGLTSVEQQSMAIAATVLLLVLANVAFQRVDWRAEQGHRTTAALARGAMMGWIGFTSILLLLLAVLLVVVEALALLVFVGAWTPTGRASLAFAGRFPLILAGVLLANALLLVLRQQVPPDSSGPTPMWRTAAMIGLSATGAIWAVVGIVWATGIPQGAGVMASIESHQAVYLVSLGAVLEFLSVRMRLRLPSIPGMLRSAIGEVRRGTESMRTEARKRAIRAYAAGGLFVAASMAGAGAMLTGAVSPGGSGTLLPVVILYSVGAAVMLGWLLVRTLQAQALQRRQGQADDPLAGLVGAKPMTPQQLARRMVYSGTGLGAALCAVFAVASFAGAMPWDNKFGTDWTIGALLLGLGPYGYFYGLDAKRARNLDSRFPEFLRDLAESARAGMTLPRALVTAADGDYGDLNDEIERMSNQVQWGVPFGEAMQGFQERTRTPLVQRTVALVLQAERAGGNVVDSLTAASEDARAIQAIAEERNAQMGLYTMVVYIAFFVFIGVVLVLLAQFLPAFGEAVAGTEGSQVGGGLGLQAFDQDDFVQLFFHAAIIQALGGGVVGGVLSRGEPRMGIPHVIVMMVSSWGAFRLLSQVILA